MAFGDIGKRPRRHLVFENPATSSVIVCGSVLAFAGHGQPATSSVIVCGSVLAFAGHGQPATCSRRELVRFGAGVRRPRAQFRPWPDSNHATVAYSPSIGRLVSTAGENREATALFLDL